MKKLFTNYNFEFDKNEKKLLTTFSKQVLKQISEDNKYFAETRAFNSILEKLTTPSESVKLTKDERTRLLNQLNENVKFLNKESANSWFIKKWIYKSMIKQYQGILENHFRG
ncbi:MAG TPA: hypothetical protein VKD08_11725 [Ignavibacteriaceae bacterium]|jgi:hypothetical protein|nr:hypothetical protein [Ignavibacteriaceae bacterium]